MSTLNVEVVNKINDLIGLDRNLLSKEGTNEIIGKLNSKIDQYKDDFMVNLPYEYTNESEFNRLCSKIENLDEKLARVKQDQSKIISLIDEYKSNNSQEQSSSSSTGDEFQMKTLILKLISIERYLIYVKTLIQLDDFSSRMDSYLQQIDVCKSKLTSSKTDSQEMIGKLNEIDSLTDKFVTLFIEMIKYCNEIIDTKCSNLKAYISKLVQFYYGKVKSILTNELENHLKTLSYPINPNSVNVATNLKAAKSNQGDKHESETTNKEKCERMFKKLASQLLKIESPDFKRSYMRNNSNDVSLTDKNPEDEDDYGYGVKNNPLINILIQPLEKRFKFHFFTNRKTNNLDKPEWYTSQILQWIKDHHEFIVHLVQPIFNEIEYLKDESALIFFSNGLVSLIKEKLEFDQTSLIKNQTQFSHTIDELILFSNQLETYLSMAETPLSLTKTQVYTSLHVICENWLLFSHWLNLERQVCQKKLDTLFIGLSRIKSNDSDKDSGSSGGGAANSNKTTFSLLNNDKQIDEIWSCNYADVDSMKPSHCAESFILMLKAITDRYRNLPYASRKLRFIYLQLELLNDFHLRLCQIIRDEVKSPFSKVYMGALNTINYIIYILEEWKNTSFFIEMQYYKVKYEQFKKKVDFNNQKKKFTGEETTENMPCDEFDELTCKSFDIAFRDSDVRKNPLKFDMEGTLFDEISPSYEKVKEDMIDTITSNCRWEITSRSKLYRKEKWMAMPLFSEYYKPTLTQSATDMLISLNNLLNLLRETLAKKLYESILKKIATELDKFFYEDVILRSQFNEGGVSQLDFDINKYLMPILGEISQDVKIENYFRRTKESLILLKLKPGSSILLKDVLNKAIEDENDMGYGEDSNANRKMSIYNAKNSLKEFGIINLNCAEAKKILSLKVGSLEL